MSSLAPDPKVEDNTADVRYLIFWNLSDIRSDGLIVGHSPVGLVLPNIKHHLKGMEASGLTCPAQ